MCLKETFSGAFRNFSNCCSASLLHHPTSQQEGFVIALLSKEQRVRWYVRERRVSDGSMQQCACASGPCVELHVVARCRPLGAPGTRPKSARGRENECGCICSSSSPSRASAGSTTSVCSQHSPPYCSTPTALT